MNNKKKKIAFHTLGCKLNYSETSEISRGFDDYEYIQVGINEIADYYVINSCSVTRKAEKKCKSLVNQIHKRNPNACIAVVGCYSQINSEEILKIPGVNIVLGNSEKFKLLEYLTKSGSGKPVVSIKNPEYKELKEFMPSYSMDGRTRSFFKIQDGCDYMCSYCTVPLARGKSRSNTIDETIKIAREIASSEVKEIVLSGVNIGDFGKIHGQSFYGLLQELLKIEGFQRIRLSSVEPDLLHDDIIELVAANKNLMPHFHIPLQSGSDKILADMGRKYDTDLFLSRVKKIRSLIPHACIAVDLIVGFPTETNALFNESFNFIKNTDISYVHVFTYSERDNTRATTILDKVSKSEANHRSRLMHELSNEKKKAFYISNINKTRNILWEKENIDGFMFGFTENYVKVKTRYDEKLVNQITEVVLDDNVIM